MKSVYTVDAESDVSVLFDYSRLKGVRGDISVRARLLRNPPVELPVQNFTTVSDKELKKEAVLVMDAAGSLYKDDKYSVGLQSAMARVEVALQAWSARLPGLKETVKPPRRDAGYDATSAARMIRTLKEADSLRKEVHDSLQAFLKVLDELFLSSDLVRDLSPDVRPSIQGRVRQLMVEFAGHAGKCGGDYAEVTGLVEACVQSSSKAYVTTRSAASQLDEASAGAKVDADRLLLAVPLGDKLARVVSPTEYAGSVLAKSDMNEVGARRDEAVAACLEAARGTVSARLEEHQELVTAVRGRLGSCAKGAKEPARCLEGNLEEIMDNVKEDVSSQLKLRVSDARVHLRDAQVEHGEFVTLIVSVTVPQIRALNLSAAGAGGASAPTVIEERFMLRVIRRGWSYSMRPQFALIKRIPSIEAATETQSPSNFEPAPGALLSFRYRRNPYYSEWLIPSVGIAAFTVDFDPRKTFELGVGPSIGILNDFIHVGAGVDLSGEGTWYRRSYYFVSFDFLKTFGTFGVVFGGGEK